MIAELVYFKIADHFNIIDKPNERSSHSTIVLRGGGVIFALSMIVWAVLMVVQGGPVVALNVPIGQWHTVHALESGSVILEVKDGPYEPIGPEDILEI